MTTDRTTHSDPFDKLYTSLRFEREGLFEFIQDTYHPTEVLYPGCAVHLTPAFYFPYVVFVDQDAAAQAFFAEHEGIRALVMRRRTYRRSPFVQFIFQDFTQPLPLPPNQFDLLLGLFVRGVARACLPHLRLSGLYLSNNHQGDAEEALQDERLSLLAVLQRRQGKYRAVEYDPARPFQVSRGASRAKRYLRNTGHGVEYLEQENYYLFKRVKL